MLLVVVLIQLFKEILVEKSIAAGLTRLLNAGHPRIPIQSDAIDVVGSGGREPELGQRIGWRWVCWKDRCVHSSPEAREKANGEDEVSRRSLVIDQDGNSGWPDAGSNNRLPQGAPPTLGRVSDRSFTHVVTEGRLRHSDKGSLQNIADQNLTRSDFKSFHSVPGRFLFWSPRLAMWFIEIAHRARLT